MADENSPRKLKSEKNEKRKGAESRRMGKSNLSNIEEKFSYSKEKRKKKKSLDNVANRDEDENVLGLSAVNDTPACVGIAGRTSGKSDAETEVKEEKMLNSRKKKRIKASASQKVRDASEQNNVVDEIKKSAKKKKKSSAKELSQDDLLEKIEVPEEFFHMSSGDEDCSQGMKKWLTQYHQSRPGIKVLQQRIDDYIEAYETREEQARKEREAQVAEGGWTVVAHHKGRKKTIDADSGVAVGSVSQATVLDKMTRKKNKEVGLDFYRFQRREAHKNEILMLQSKFEKDKQRIQQMRAARKFRPY